MIQMLNAREERANLQMKLLKHYGKPVISFCMNIPGPVKDSPLIRRGFAEGYRELEKCLPPEKLLHREIRQAVTGCEGMYVADMDPVALKCITTAIEDNHGLGRLFDLDVIGPDGKKLDRDLVGGGRRDCIVCGAPGRGCASRRAHSVRQLQEAAEGIFRAHYAQKDMRNIGALAVQCLIEEVHTTPKPGLVDCRNTGSHRDMDVKMFLASAGALKEYFQNCAAAGQKTAEESPEETFQILRQLGLQAEQNMYRATGGINTHKGAIFTIGILCGAAGRLWRPEGLWDEAQLFREVASMTHRAMEEDWKRNGDTAGYRLYHQFGIRGIRGEAAQGLPTVEQTGLPVFRGCLEQGLDRNQAGVVTLLHLIAQVADTNMIARGGMEGAEAAREQVRTVLSQPFSLAAVERLDDWFIARNLSAGGCADLLAAVYFVEYLSRFSK